MRFSFIGSMLAGTLALWSIPALAEGMPDAPEPSHAMNTVTVTEPLPVPTGATPAPAEATRPARVRWQSPGPDAVLFRPGAVRLEWSSTFPAGTFYSVTMARDGKTFQNVISAWQTGTSAEWTPPEQERFNYFLRVKAMNAEGAMLDEHVIPVHVVPEDAIIISKENQTLWAFQKGKLMRRLTISTGSKKTETRAGWFAVYSRVPNHHSSIYDAPMPFSLFFSGGMALHASTYVDELGTATSHGCVRLRYSDAKALYDASEVGRPVIVTPWGEDMGYLDTVREPDAVETVQTARDDTAETVLAEP